MSKSYSVVAQGREAEEQSQGSKYFVKVLTDDVEFRGEVVSPKKASYLDILGSYTVSKRVKGKMIGKLVPAVLRIPKSRIVQFRTLSHSLPQGARPDRNFNHSFIGA